MKNIIWGSESNEDLQSFGGGKATNLARVEKVGVPTPPWFCLSSQAFEHFIASLKSGDVLQSSHAEIEKKFLSMSLDSSLVEEIKAAVTKLGAGGNGVAYAVRSSGIGEDSAENSFAGQFSSYLNQQNIDQIVESIKLCWASAFTERSMAYRKERGLSLEHFKMGVIVQRMIFADVAGVSFSRDPIHPTERQQLIVSSVFGLGEGLVSGELDADTFYVKRPEAHADFLKKTLEYKSELTEKKHQFVKKANGGIEKLVVAEEKQKASSLTDEQLKTVSAATILLEEKLGLPQDVEWVFENGEFYCVQTRPITTLPQKAFYDVKVRGNDYILWDNSNITESYNGVTSPLTFSHISRAYFQVYLQFCEVMGVPPELVQKHVPTFRNMLGLVRGRVFYNLVNWYQMIYLFPFAGASKGFMETMMGVKQGLKPEIAQLFDFSKNPIKYSPFRLTYLMFNNILRMFKVKAIIDQFKADFDRVYIDAKKQNFNEKSIKELIDYYDHLNTELLYKWKAPIINDTRCMIFFGTLKSLTDKWIKSAGNESVYNDLLSGEGDLPSTEPTKILMKIAKKIDEGDAEFRSWFLSSSPQVILEKFSSDKGGEVAKDFYAYIDKYGFRCINELKLESVDLHEDPKFAVDVIINFVRMKNTSVDKIIEREKETRAKAEEIVRQNLSGLKLRIYFFFAVHARKAVKDREDLRLLRTNIFGIARRIFKALGQRFWELGIIEEPSDIFYLSVEEIFAYQEGRSFAVDFKGLVAARKAQYDDYRKTPAPPDRFVSEGTAALNFLYPQVLADQDLLSKDMPKSDDPNVLLGTSCCPGIVEGVVRVVHEASDAEGMNGEIMVSERTDPGWVPLFPSASGLLIERGSLLSHSAVVARELGIPTIVGVHGGLLKRLKTGMRVRMDAGRGEIRILE